MAVMEAVQSGATSQDDAARLLEESCHNDAFCLGPAEILCMQKKTGVHLFRKFNDR